MAEAAETPENPNGVPPLPAGAQRKVRAHHVLEMKRAGRPIVMITAYDSTFAQLADEGGADMILVGDSVGMVQHGHETTLPMTMETMLLHTRAVTCAPRRAMVVADMPFLSYQACVAEAVRNAGRFLQEARAEAVKVEGRNASVLPAIKAISDAGIPVVGHIGLVPQSVHALGGYRVQGRQESDAEVLVELALAQQASGAFCIVLEAIPAAVAERITAKLAIPTIGIGAGAKCDGQVLVMHDLLGLTAEPPKFVRRYADLRSATLRAFRKFGRDVRERTFPGDEESYG